MPDEINNDDKKAQYLKRDEVRTMEKDIARLRELEAETAREKISQIKTGEEAQLEAQRIEQARLAAEERERQEAETKIREEELTKSRAEKVETAETEAAVAAQKEEAERESLKTQLRQAQSSEEEARRKFLENISRQAGDEDQVSPPPIWPRPAPPPMPETPPEIPKPETPPVPPIPETPAIITPPVPQPPKKPFKFSLPKVQLPKIQLPKVQLPKVQLPKVQLPKVPIPKVKGYFPTKPSIFEKIWIRIIVSLFILAILATVITFWYWYLAVKPISQPQLQPILETPETPAKREPEIIQNHLRIGYFLPASVRVIDAIIVHSGDNVSNGNPYDLDGIIQSYKTAGVATHYLIGRDGAIYQLAPDYAIAYHAGAGKMPDGRTGVNNFSIGISLIYQESENPNDAQYESLSWLIGGLTEKYSIPAENILGYKDIAPSKNTPWNFDWIKLKQLISSAAAASSRKGGGEFILSGLTLEEKIGQLLVIGFEGVALNSELERFINTVHPGGVLLFQKNIESPSQIKKLSSNLQQTSLSQTGLPLFVAIDQEGGAVSRLHFIREKTGQSDIKTADEAYKIGEERGRELKELGINLNLAPVLDLTEGGDFMHERSFQREPGETGILAKSLAFGQKAGGILTAIKHFPGYGGINFNPEEKMAILADAPGVSNFQKAMEANPELVMLASVIYVNIDPNVPVTFSPKAIALAKEKLGETPLLITDDLAQKSFLDNFPPSRAVVMAIKAGADLLLFSDYQSGINAASILKQAVQKGDMSEELINSAALRIIRLKKSHFKL